MVAGWSSGSMLASVLENCMFFHCKAKKTVTPATPNRMRILLRRIMLATLGQNPLVSFATMWVLLGAKVENDMLCS